MQARNWVFTLNNPDHDDEDKIKALSSFRYLVYGRETGNSGTFHLQGFVMFPSARRLSTLSRILPRAHWEVSRGSPQQASEYCKKDGNFFESGSLPDGKKSQGERTDLKTIYKLISDGVDETIIAETYPEQYSRYFKAFQRYRLLKKNSGKKAIRNHELHEWQKALLDEFKEEADERQVLFVIDPEGNKGKSWFCYYCLNNVEDVQLIDPGKKADMAFELDPQTRILLIDCARSRKDVLDYHFIEKVKDGVVFSSKYESLTKFMKHNVHVVVFMNEDPDMSKLSNDRYRFLNI